MLVKDILNSFPYHLICTDTLADATSIAVTCDAKYRPMTVSYDITVSWKLDPLAAAAVSMYTVHLLGKNLQTFDPSAGSKEVEVRGFSKLCQVSDIVCTCSLKWPSENLLL